MLQILREYSYITIYVLNGTKLNTCFGLNFPKEMAKKRESCSACLADDFHVVRKEGSFAGKALNHGICGLLVSFASVLVSIMLRHQHT